MIKDLSEIHFAYLAGIIDGEGCIYIGSHSFNKKTGARYFTTAIQVVNTDIRLINRLHDTFGGLKSGYTPAQTPKVHRKKPYVWKVTGDELTFVCHKILPYSNKKEQIEVMLEMRKTYELLPSQRKKINPSGWQPLSKELQDLRFSLMHKLRSLRT